MSQNEVRRGRVAFWFTVAAFVWSVALVAAAFWLPVYSSSSVSSAGAHVSGSATLVQVNGLWALVPMGVPLIVVVLAWAALYRKCSRGSPVAAGVASALLAVLIAGCLVALASVGLLIVPVAVLLALAVVMTPSGGSGSDGLTATTG